MVEVCDGKSRCNEGGGSWSTAGRNNQRIDFGDPCFGIWKYINVTYVCRSTLPADSSSGSQPLSRAANPPHLRTCVTSSESHLVAQTTRTCIPNHVTQTA
ncbi:MAG: hypothetical protein WDW36_007452 [Sanguina aurantia]